jgi:hypothetical protein
MIIIATANCKTYIYNFVHEMQRTELYNHYKDKNKVDSDRFFFQPKVSRPTKSQTKSHLKNIQ